MVIHSKSYELFYISNQQDHGTMGLCGTLGDDGDKQRKLSTLDQRKLSTFGISTSCLCMSICDPPVFVCVNEKVQKFIE